MKQDHPAGTGRQGAPYAYSDNPGPSGGYTLGQVFRSTRRALALALDKPAETGKKRKRGIAIEALRDGQSKLSQIAAIQQLRVVEQPLIALHADPVKDKPGDWTWELLLPILGQAKADPDAGVSLKRIYGGAYVETVTTGGFDDLDNLYRYLIGEYLPEHKQQLSRPVILHRVMDGLAGDGRTPLTLAVYVPIVLSLRRPPAREPA
jgi:DNA gyrase inhibitor GyrI